MEAIPGSEILRRFVGRYSDVGILSTGAQVVDYSGDLYNVKGSTEDPKGIPDHKGWSWKRLLVTKANLGGASCYVSNFQPTSGSSHPDFSVGGHMAVTADGIVADGADSYLMPLCSWHNSTARDGKAFGHSETRMLKLTGYMQGELAATFAMRLRPTKPYALIYFDTDSSAWDFEELDVSEVVGSDLARLSRKMSEGPTSCDVLIERDLSGEGLHFIRDHNVPQ